MCDLRAPEKGFVVRDVMRESAESRVAERHARCGRRRTKLCVLRLHYTHSPNTEQDQEHRDLTVISLTRAENRPFASKLSFATKKNGKTGTSEDIIRLAKVLTRNKIESRRAGTEVILSFGVHDGL